jgi:hypothetical protein
MGEIYAGMKEIDRTEQLLLTSPETLEAEARHRNRFLVSYGADPRGLPGHEGASITWITMSHCRADAVDIDPHA